MSTAAVAKPEAVSPAALWLVVAGLLAVFAPTLVWLWGRWTLSVWHNAHGLLLVPVVGYFVREELVALRHLPRSSNVWGFAILLPALALHALDAGMHTELLSAAALVLALPGLALLMLGTPRAKAILVPLMFLALALPIPLSFTERIHLVLRHIATAGTAWVVPMFGIPVFVEGTTLNTAHGALEVADACSGFSTLYAAVAVAMLTAYQSASPARRASPRSRARRKARSPSTPPSRSIPKSRSATSPAPRSSASRPRSATRRSTRRSTSCAGNAAPSSSGRLPSRQPPATG